MNYYKLLFSSDVNKTIRSQININPNEEFALLAISQIEMNKIVVKKIFYISTSKIDNYQAIIPRYNQMSLLKYCKQSNEIPTIIHSHVGCNSLSSFSIQDDLFEIAIAKVSLKINCEFPIISILFKENVIKLRILENQKFTNIAKFTTNYFD